MRTHYCGAVTAADIGNTVTLCGWAHRRRDHGGKQSAGHREFATSAPLKRQTKYRVAPPD